MGRLHAEFRDCLVWYPLVRLESAILKTMFFVQRIGFIMGLDLYLVPKLLPKAASA
jgi:hypothetical protein